jgi:probable rRNA maturation factor
MTIHFVNNSSLPLPRTWIRQFVEELNCQLREKKSLGFLQSTVLTIVFLDKAAARKINRQFRKRDYATDILSFQSETPKTHLGELLICPQVLKAQAKEHSHSFKAELGYMLIHGVLHLLGYDHEGRGPVARKKAERMFKLQDQLFDSLRVKFHL